MSLPAMREVEAENQRSAGDDFPALEEKIYKAIELLKSAREAQAAAERDANRLRDQLEQREEELELVRAEVVSLRKEREEVFASLPKPISAQYSRIGARIRDGVAVAEARNRSCSACFMSLRPQMMAEIRRGDEIITCDNCGRILYVVPAEPVKADAAKTQPNVAIS